MFGERSLSAARLQKALQDKRRGHAIDRLPPFGKRGIHVVECAVRLCGGEALVPQVDGKSEALPQFVRELLHPLRLRPFPAAHVQRIADNDLAHLARADHLLEGGEIALLILSPDGVETLRGDAQGIGDGHADGSGTYVQGEDPKAGHGRNYIGGQWGFALPWMQVRMATHEIKPDVAPGESPESGPNTAPGVAAAEHPQRELLAELSPVLAPVRVGSAAQVVLAVVSVLALCYVAKLLLVTLFTSVLLAFVLAPMVEKMERQSVPRPLGAALAVLFMLALLYAAMYFSYNKAVQFTQELPKYSKEIRSTVLRFREQAKSIQKTTESILPSEPADKNTVRVEQRQTWADFLGGMAGSVTEFVFIVSFIPFLVYFMLTWQGHMRSATVMLFRMENRNTAYVTLGQISAMMRSFIVGNAIVGAFMAVLSIMFFAFMKLPYFYFIGFISGFLSLVPYLGVVLALVPPLAASLGVLKVEEMAIVAGFVLGLHLFAFNVLYPKILGRRLQLNPLILTVALLVWGWLWGAMGLILAVPITAAMKIIFDHVDSLRAVGAWMGE